MKLHNVMKRFMALLLTFALMVGMVGTEALAETFPGWDDISESESGESEGLDHVHNQDGWVCTRTDDVRELTCTLEEHVHTDACYAPVEHEAEPICGKEEDPGHTHTDECYEETTTYTCGLEESEGHKHGPECYADPELICDLDESDGHKHDDSCYETKQVLTCEKEEAEGHTHTDECYDAEGNLICELEETEGHTHDDSCYTEEKVLVCKQDESEGHHHSEECYGEPKLICKLEESEGHKHTEECTKVEKKLICKEEEREGHTHTAACYAEEKAPVLICGKKETLGHTHGETCYIEKQVLICGQEEDHGTAHGDLIDADSDSSVTYTGHVHGPECWEVQKVLVCDKKEEEAHKHTAECYEDGVMPERGELICGKEEHTHTDECYTVTEGEWTCVAPEEPQDDGIATIARLPSGVSFSNNKYSYSSNVLTIKGAGTLTVNSTLNGTVVINTSGTVNITGSGMINAANRNASAIRIQGGATVVLNGVTVTGGRGTNVNLHGWYKTTNGKLKEDWLETRDNHYFRVGGGIYVENGELKLISGNIYDNTAQRGGGIFVDSDGKLTMEGGIVSNNSTVNRDSSTAAHNYAGEGGGIFVRGIATISGGQIINNKCTSTTDLGGGGLYVNNGGIATLINAKVTGNTAYGFGGGIAGCCHGEISTVATDGVALFDNIALGYDSAYTHTDGSKNGGDVIDHHISAKKQGFNGGNTADFYTAGSSIISNYMVGGGSAQYTGRVGDYKFTSGYNVDNNNCPAGEDLVINDDEVKVYEKKNVGLTARPSEADKASARECEGVLISGNTSTIHGGGIGCNGGLYFGIDTNQNIVTNKLNLTLNGLKYLDGQASSRKYTFELSVSNSNGTLKKEASNDAKGNIKFEFTNYDEIKKYITSGNSITFYLKEKEKTDNGIVFDKSEYKVDVKLTHTDNTRTVQLEHTTDNNKFNKITVTYIERTYSAESKTITRTKNSKGEQDNTVLGNITPTFNNYTKGSLVIDKTVLGGGALVQDATYHFVVTGPGNYWKDVYVTTKDGHGVSEKLENLTPGEYTVTESAPNLGSYTWNGVISGGDTVVVTAGSDVTVHATNNFTPQPVTWKPSVKKLFDGNDTDPNQESRTFNFNLTLNGTPTGVTMPVATQVAVTSDDEWTASFGEITFTESGMYDFTIREQDPNIAGYKKVAEPQNITVVVSDINGQLTVTAVNDASDTNASFVFTNTFDFVDTSWTPSVQKHMVTNGYEIPKGYEQTFTFTFEQTDATKLPGMEDGQKVDIESPYDKLGYFNKVTFTEPGEYHFKIAEQFAEHDGYTYDQNYYDVTVTVTDDGNGTLSKQITSTKSKTSSLDDRFTMSLPAVDITGETHTFEFTNTYKPIPTSATLKVHKEVIDENNVGAIAAPTTFTFKLVHWTNGTDPRFELSTDVEEKTITLEGTTFEGDVEFSALNFERPGVYHYRITEEAGNAAGFSYDNTIHEVTITVTDVNGQLVPTVVYENESDEDSANFKNIYNPGKVYYQPQVSKKILGEPTVTSKTFTFVLKYSEPYASDGKFTEGRLKEIDRIQMALWAGQTSNIASFKMLEFDKPGTYVYQIEEVKPDNAETGYKGYTFDDTIWTLTIKVSDHDGVLAIDSKVYSAPGHEDETDLAAAAFENRYDVEPTQLQLSVLKKMTGDPRPGTISFVFELTNNNEPGVTMPNLRSAIIPIKTDEEQSESSFGAIEFTKAGKYTFIVYEVQGTTKGYTFDETKHEIVVTVVDRSSQLVITNVTVDGEDATVQAGETVPVVQVEFTNNYQVTAGTFAPSITKHVVGDVPQNVNNHVFTFKLSASEQQNKEGNAVLPKNTEASVTITSDAKEVKKSFEDITFKQAGTYYFTISELDNDKIPGYEYDTTEYQLVVEVKDVSSQLTVTKVTVNKLVKGSGEVEVVETFSENQVAKGLETVNFTNFYKTEKTSYTPLANKRIEGTPTDDNEEYRFEIKSLEEYDDEVVIMPQHTTVSRIGAGDVEFDEITFTKTGTYRFSIKELPGTDRNCDYDASEWLLTVTVRDDKSELKATGTYTAANESAEKALFVNVYNPTPTPTPTTTDEPTPTPDTTPTPENTPAPSDQPTPTPENTPTPSEQPTPTPTNTTPENPNNPNTPDTPDNPNTPNNPNTPENPQNPNTPENPVNEQQDYPEQNDTPNNPNVPNAPENQPNMDLPNDDVPLAEADRPNTPDTPVVPNTPNNPSAPEDEPGLDLPDSDIPLADMPPQTGETIMNMVWMSLLVASGAGIMVTAKGKKKEED